jgi:redox-sensing transcriptional repressor
MANGEVPKVVVKRLPVYLRILDNLMRRDVDIVLSRELSEETGYTAEQIRKDLTVFGAFGTRGNGYNVAYLRHKIINIIGLSKKTPVIIVGAGYLGKAISRHNMTKNPYVDIVGLFDNDPKLIGEKILDMEIAPASEISRIVSEKQVKVAMVTVPAAYAQGVVNELVEYGINAILNFAPTKLKVPEGVHLHNADFTIDLQSLIYYVSTDKKQEANTWGKSREDKYNLNVVMNSLYSTPRQ